MERERNGKATILVVDDDAEFRESLAEILEDEGYHVAQAGNGRDALSYLRKTGQPNLVLLNLVMPAMNGWACLAELREDPVFDAVPVLVLSGAEQAQPEAARLNAAGFILKPVEVPVLLETVRGLCSK